MSDQKHVMTQVPVANGAGKVICSCGWHSKVHDDGYPNMAGVRPELWPDWYTDDPVRDWREHAAAAAAETQHKRRPEPPCFICGKLKGQPPERCPGHYDIPEVPAVQEEVQYSTLRTGFIVRMGTTLFDNRYRILITHEMDDMTTCIVRPTRAEAFAEMERLGYRNTGPGGWGRPG